MQLLESTAGHRHPAASAVRGGEDGGVLLHRLAAEHFILDDGPDYAIRIGESAQRNDLDDQELGEEPTDLRCSFMPETSRVQKA